MEKLKEWACISALRLGSILVAAYFFYVFHSMVGFPPEKELNTTSITYLIISIFFFLLPLAKKIKLGKLLEYEAKVNEIKNEVKEFKDESRQILSMQNTLINTVSNTINQNININLPGEGEIQEAKEQLNKTIKKPTSPVRMDEEIKDYLASEDDDINFALVKLRVDIERELRRILEKRPSTEETGEAKSKFFPVRVLFREFTSKYPVYKGMHASFDYILKICNAAIHGQSVSYNYAQEAFYMGLKMLDELKKVDNNVL